MAKTRASADQFAFTFDAPQPATLPAALAGVDARVARTVAEVLKNDDRDRLVIAAAMSVLLDEEVSKAMLDAYASPARDGHNISFARMLALIAVTNRFDLLDRELRAIGAAVLVGEEIYTAEIGHIDSEIEKL
ncbi:hypothetical protein, partial [Sphingobium yanoikuyae]